MLTDTDVQRLLNGEMFDKELAVKHGFYGKKGDEGEKFFADFFKRRGWQAHIFSNQIDAQKRGIDVVLTKGDGKNYDVDVKNNLTAENNIPVETNAIGWLYNPNKTSDFIAHVNAQTKQIAVYRRKKMQDYILNNFEYVRSDLIYLTKGETNHFVRWYNVT